MTASEIQFRLYIIRHAIFRGRFDGNAAFAVLSILYRQKRGIPLLILIVDTRQCNRQELNISTGSLKMDYILQNNEIV